MSLLASRRAWAGWVGVGGWMHGWTVGVLMGWPAGAACVLCGELAFGHAPNTACLRCCRPKLVLPPNPYCPLATAATAAVAAGNSDVAEALELLLTSTARH